MAVELTPQEQVRLPNGLRCPSRLCQNRRRKFVATTGILTDMLNGRHVIVQCTTCGNYGKVEA